MNSESISPATSSTQPDAVPASRPSFPFGIAAVVFLLVVITTTLVTLVLPEWYCSTARIEVQRDQTDIPGVSQTGQVTPSYDPYFIQTEFEVLQSETILANVIAHLELQKIWGEKYVGPGSELKLEEAMTILKPRLDLRPVRGTSLIEIHVFCEQNEGKQGAREVLGKELAAKIANEIARVYQDYRIDQRRRMISGGIAALEVAYKENSEQIQAVRSEIAALTRDPGKQDALDDAKRRLDNLQDFGSVLLMKLATEKADALLPATSMVSIVDHATPGLRPVRPNMLGNIFLGILVGGVSGTVLATLIYVLQCRAYRRISGIPRRQFPPRFRAVVHVLIALVVGFFVGFLCASPQTLIGIPLILLLGGIGSAYIELANPHPLPTRVGPDQTDSPNPDE